MSGATGLLFTSAGDLYGASFSSVPSQDPNGLGYVDKVPNGGTETAYAGRDAPFLVTAEVNWSDPSQSDAAIAYGREVWDPMAQHSTGGLYLNFPGFGEEGEDLVRASVGATTHQRLAAVKAQYDPSNLFRLNMNVSPQA